MARSWAVIVTLVVATLVGAALMERRPRTPIAASESVVVVKTLDGDTILVARAGTLADAEQITVRLLGIDTPETHHPTKPVGCFGPEAEAYTRSRLLGRTVRLELDTEFHDRYGRLLATVIVDGSSYSRELIDGGYARLLVIAPNVRHARELLLAEAAAREARRGLWGACS